MTETDNKNLEKLIEGLQKSEEDINACRTIDFSEFKEKLTIMYSI